MNSNAKRDAAAEERAYMQCSSGCEHTDRVWQRHLKIGFQDGWDARDEEVAELRAQLAYYKNGTQIKEVHYDEMYAIENASLKQQVKDIKALHSGVSKQRIRFAEKINVLEEELKTKDEVIEVILQAGKHLSDVLEHAVEMGQYTEGGSTEGWAKLSLKEWNAAFTKINTLLGREKV